MDEQNFWQRMWPLFMSDPPTFLALMAAVAVPVATAAWWLKSTVAAGTAAGLNGKIEGLNSQIAVSNERLMLAVEQNKDAQCKLDALRTEIAELKKQVEARPQTDQIKEAVKKTERLFDEAQLANNQVSTTLSSGGLLDSMRKWSQSPEVKEAMNRGLSGPAITTVPPARTTLPSDRKK